MFAVSTENGGNSQGSSPIKTSPSKSTSPAKVATGAPYSRPADPNKFVKRGTSDAAPRAKGVRRRQLEPVLNERLRGNINQANGVRRSLASQGLQNNSTPQVRMLTDTDR